MKKDSLQLDWGLNLARMTGVMSLALGAIVLLGWYLHEPALIQVNPAFVPMQYNTALGFALGGLALMGLAWHWPRIAVITGVIVLLTGVLTLIEYSFGADLHIDQLFMEHYIDLKTSNPGRMAPNTALCFSLTGLTVLLTTLFHERARITAWTATLGALIISLGVTALAGYMIGVEGAYGWGHMTRMAIHTAAGFIILGSGFIALAWTRNRLMSPGESLPRWVPLVIGITGLTITFALWQAMSAQELRMLREMGAGAANFSDEGLLVFGILLTFTLVFKARAVAKAGRGGRRTGRDYAPYIVITLGALLAASLYSLLQTSFESSVKQRFEAAALNHVEAIEHGIEAYLETLYHVRSGFDASSFVDRDEFRTLVSRSLARNPGIVALEWVPRISAQERDAMEAVAREEVSQDFVFGDKPAEGGMTAAAQREVYFPIYYVEPQEEFLSVLGFDLAARPDYLATLMKAARTNTPVVSSRLQLFQSEKGTYSVFVALPIYQKGLPLDAAGEREAALRGFAVMVTEIGPMVEAILGKNTGPAGLTLTFEDTEARGAEAFMYRHVSRELDLGPDNSAKDYLDDGLTSTTSLAFADHHWQVTAHAASRKIYPDRDAGSFWLPLGVLLLSLGLAGFLYRIKQTEAELAHSRMLMHTILEHSPAAIHLKDLKGRYLVVNRVWSELIGVPEARAIGATIHDFKSPEIARELDSNDRRVTEAGKAMQCEEHVPQDDGMVRTYMTYKFPVADENGKVFAIGGVSSDITEIKQRERQYRVLVDTIPGTVYRCRLDENWTNLFISNEVETLTGYPSSEFLDNAVRSFTSVIHPDDTARIYEVVVQAIAEHRPYTVEYRIIRSDGELRYVYERGQAEYGDDDKAEVLDGTIIDVTELKSLQKDLEQAKEAADAANQAKSAFLANMSHELRTPMNAILGYSEMLMEEAEDLEQEGFIPDLKKINQAGTHLLALINDVLDLSKIESGKMEAFAEEVNLDRLIDEVGATAQPLMGKNGNKLSIERGKDLGNAHQDLTKLRQMLFNLLSNAAKFTHEGTVTLHVNRSEQAGEDWLTFAISDTGIGIAEDKLEHVFEEFAQADDSTTRDYGGTGLGLAITRRFCKLLGGDLNVYSQLGEGSTFTIRVPAILPGFKPQHPPAEMTPAMTGTELDSLRKAGPGSMILVIDDDPEACEIIERYLVKDGYAVVTAGSGEQGLRLAHEIHPAVITLDVMMPSMDGWSVLAALKADPVLRKIPVVMLTMIDDRTRGYSLGAVDYLTKPVDRELLHKALSRYYCTEDSCSVLLIEDDPETRDVMARTLKKVGWSVSEAGNGQEALELMDTSQPHLILLDLMMPVMDGFEFLTAMRAQPEWRHIPVIVVTAKDLTEEDRNRLVGSVEQVLEKNAYTREQLLERVRESVATCNIRGASD